MRAAEEVVEWCESRVDVSFHKTCLSGFHPCRVGSSIREVLEWSAPGTNHTFSIWSPLALVASDLYTWDRRRIKCLIWPRWFLCPATAGSGLMWLGLDFLSDPIFAFNVCRKVCWSGKSISSIAGTSLGWAGLEGLSKPIPRMKTTRRLWLGRRECLFSRNS